MGWDEHPVGQSGAIGADVVARTTRAIRATLEGDSVEVGALFAPDVHASLHGSVWSAVALAVEIEDRHGAFEDVDLRIGHALDHGDEIWIEWFASVVHAKSLALDDIVIEPSGKRVELRGVTIAHCRGGRIVEFRQYCDMSPLLGSAPVDLRPPHRDWRQPGVDSPRWGDASDAPRWDPQPTDRTSAVRERGEPDECSP